MAMMTNARQTTTVLSDHLAIDLGDKISLLDADKQPLNVFSKKAQKKKTVATKFSWLEDRLRTRFDTLNGAVASTTTTTLTVSHGTYWMEHYVGLNTRTGEAFLVQNVTGNVITVVRGTGSTAANMNDADELRIIGVAKPEGDRSRPARSDNPTKATNYTQIFEEPYAQSGSLMASAFQVSPADWPQQARKAAIEHALDIEDAFLFGKKALITGGEGERRLTGGVLSFISTNQTDAGGDLSEAEWNAANLQGFRYGSGSKLVLASGVAVGALNKFPASKIQTRQDESTYGINVSHYITPFGSVNLVYHPRLEGTKYSGFAIGLDMEQVAYRYLGNDEESRDTHIRQNVQEKDRDGRKDLVFTECGLQLGLEQTHFVLTGITS
jgi:hypothetical protein